MSYGIYLYRQDARGLVEVDRQSVRAALARWDCDGSQGSPYQVRTTDGVTADFYASGLDGGEPFHGGNLEVHGYSIELCRLILDLARAGPFVITHDGDASAVMLASEGQRADLPAALADDPRLMICRTPGELNAALEGGFDTWREFRDGACGRRPEGGPA